MCIRDRFTASTPPVQVLSDKHILTYLLRRSVLTACKGEVFIYHQLVNQAVGKDFAGIVEYFARYR